MYSAAQFTENAGTEQKRDHPRIATHAARLAMTVDTERASELCPPHWRLPPRRSFRSRLKTAIHTSSNILGKQSSPQKISGPSSVMRMKDSDDYITARAANPRTGLVSPSVGTRTPCTPDSPGDALKLRANGETTLTPGSSSRAARCKASEGRKMVEGSTATGPFHEHRWHSNRTFRTDSATTERLDIQNGSQRRDSAAGLKDDQLIQMPSAREPQPFAYPGYTPEQIEALKHYRQKTRRVSSEGYDRRLLCDAEQHSTELDGAHAEDAICPGIPGQPQFKPYRHQLTEINSNPPSITVRKRKAPRSDTDTTSNGPRRFVDKVETEATTSFTPFAFPKETSVDNKKAVSTSREFPRTVPENNVCRATGHVSGKSIGSAPSREPVANSANVDHHHAEPKQSGSSQPPVCVPGSFDAADLSCRPRVKLVRPELAAVPRAKLPVTAVSRDASRKCSLGCRRQSDQQEECAEVRKASSPAVIHRCVSSRAADQELKSEITSLTGSTLSAEVMLDIVMLLLSYVKSLEMPKVAVIEVLTSSEASTTEKIVALKAVLSLAAHALAVCTTLAMLWKLGAATMHLLEVLLWPLMVPLRMLRWIVGLG